MKYENYYLSVLVAGVTSIVFVLALFWTPIMFELAAGLAVFLWILSTGFHVSGGRLSFCDLCDAAMIWIWLFMLVGFAIISGMFWLWIFGFALLLSFVTGAWKRLCCLCCRK